MRTVRKLTLSLLLICLLMGSYVKAAKAAPPLNMIEIAGSGDISTVVNLYRTLLGPDNGGEPGSHGRGRREINWDKVPDESAAPNFLPPDFFNAPASPRARGAVLNTPGKGVMVSANSSNPTNTPVRFGNINPSYP